MAAENRTKYWRRRILFTLWLTYASFYLCRVNISIAIPKMIQDLGFSKTAMGGVLSSFLLIYCLGQFFSGRLGDKFGARRLVSLGILGSALLNLLFGFSKGFIIMLVIWGLNGLFQSTGWAPMMGTLANWFPDGKRGRVGGIMGTSYLVGTIFTWISVGFFIDALGWRWGFWIPSLIFALLGFHWYLRVRDEPKDVKMEGQPGGENSNVGTENGRMKDHSLRSDLTSSTVIYSAFSLLFLNVVRYGVLGWIPTYISGLQEFSISMVTLESSIVPLGGIVGVLGAGWLSDKFTGRRRGLLGSIMGVFLGVTLIFSHHLFTNLILLLLGLFVLGVTINGPNILLAGLIPIDVGEGETTSSIAGFLNGVGYIGGIVTGFATGLFIDMFGWSGAFHFWEVSAFLSSFFMWMTSRKE
ncbi:hypothetical protein AKJ65_06105 [candidate division MSBL1 archaeon SCGC-AAA259E19]|uniref:Major facilitator superfamily (MFS) profile domain-containing protein n=2 Tax=candidate division MSBL1 TaxID=215777 RepID=A0A133UY69_9EURY|nr:hypothetical protein AKJ65_06105 [candidate division MSBL1 archaeon SCGC-AAA259E19]KXA99120.1 hypothetical protein AKJ41_05920 [candidate division MSBL1 archaeon SCGC-AAA259O05]